MTHMTWTTDRIRTRLGISTAVYQKVRLGARQIAQIREAGIPKIELSCVAGCFDYQDQQQASEVLHACKAEGVEIVALHGPFKLPYGEETEEARKRVVSESLPAIRLAEESGAGIYVGHFGRGDHSRRNIEELLPLTEGLQVKLTTENMGGKLAPYVSFVDEIGSPRLGLTVDVGHTRDDDGRNPFTVAGRARETVGEARTCLSHIHLHESFDIPRKPDHRPPLHPDGIIEWGEIFGGLRDVDYSGELVFEDGRGEDPETWVRMTGEFPEGFVARYEGEGPG
jgi:sugar phosphate isomerase/epimerase